LVNWYNSIGAGERNMRNQDVKMKSWFEKKKETLTVRIYVYLFIIFYIYHHLPLVDFNKTKSKSKIISQVITYLHFHLIKTYLDEHLNAKYPAEVLDIFRI
jgi:hypothetical protein